MARPRLLLIDDEPALAAFVANAAASAASTRSSPTTTSSSASSFSPSGPRWSRSTSACRAWTASSCSASSPTQDYRAPVLIISGFDRRVLESAFRLGEALGLNMVGPLEKPVRLEELEAILDRAEGHAGAMIAAGRARPARRLRAGADQQPAAHGLSAQGVAARRPPEPRRGAGPLGRSGARRRSRRRASCRWPSSTG